MSGRSIKTHLNSSQRKVYADLRNQVRDFIDNAERYGNIQGDNHSRERGIILNSDYQLLARCYVIRRGMADVSSYANAEYGTVEDWKNIGFILKRVTERGVDDEDLSRLDDIVKRLFPDTYTSLLLENNQISEMRGQVRARWERVRAAEVAKRFQQIKEKHGDTYRYYGRPYSPIGTSFSVYSTPVDIGIDFAKKVDGTITITLGRPYTGTNAKKRIATGFHRVTLVPSSSGMIMTTIHAVDVIQRKVHPGAYQPVKDSCAFINRGRQLYLSHLMCAYYSLKHDVSVSPKVSTGCPHATYYSDRGLVSLQSSFHPHSSGIVTRLFTEQQLMNLILETYTLLAIYPQTSFMDLTK